MSARFGLPVVTRRRQIVTQIGDAALILRIGKRLPTGHLRDDAENAAIAYELAWLERFS